MKRLEIILACLALRCAAFDAAPLLPFVARPTSPADYVLVPQMTASNAPAPFVAFAGTTYNVYEAWRAFDRSTAGSSRWDGYPSGAGNFLAIDFGAGIMRIVSAYSIQADGSNGSRCPTGWALEVSSDGATWSICETRSVSAFANGELRTFTNAAPISARYHRLRIIATAAAEPIITEWQLIGH